jgi:hypothetical protein
MRAELARDSATSKALDGIERAERRFYLFATLLAALEMLFLYGFVQLADFSNRVHVLIFWSTVSTFTVGVVAVAVLWRHVSRVATLILKAIDLSTKMVLSETPSENGAPGTRGV